AGAAHGGPAFGVEGDAFEGGGEGGDVFFGDEFGGKGGGDFGDVGVEGGDDGQSGGLGFEQGDGGAAFGIAVGGGDRGVQEDVGFLGFFEEDGVGLVAEPADGVEESKIACELVDRVAHRSVSDDGEAQFPRVFLEDLGIGLEGLGD